MAIDLLALFGMRTKVVKARLTDNQIATIVKTVTRKTKNTRRIEAQEAASHNDIRETRAGKRNKR